MSSSFITESADQKQRRAAAASGSGRSPLSRLLRMILVLQSGTAPNAKQLGDLCEVSRRTVYRDLESLELAGVPLRYNHDRQGYQLARGFFLQPTALAEEEVFAILVMAREWSEADGLGLVRHARDGATKLVQGLPAEARTRILSSAESIQERSPDAVGISKTRREIELALISALSRRKQLRLSYRDTTSLEMQSTKFTIYRLLHHEARWFLVGRSSAHRRVEVLPLDSIRQIMLTDDPASIPPGFNLERFLGLSWGLVKESVRHRVWLRFSPEIAPEVEGRLWHRSQKMTVLADGYVELNLTVDGVAPMVRWILGFGDQVEVLAPEELRRLLHEIASRIAQRSAPGKSAR